MEPVRSESGVFPIMAAKDHHTDISIHLKKFLDVTSEQANSQDPGDQTP